MIIQDLDVWSFFFKKFEVLEALKKFKVTIELKLRKLIRCVHLDMGGEFYG